VNPDRRGRPYLFVGLIRCRVCGRLMDSHWANTRPGYRCRHGNRNILTPTAERVSYIYTREDRIIAGVAVLLGLTRLNPQAIIDQLRECGLVIYCDRDGLITIEDAQNAGRAIAAIPQQRSRPATPT
jgi:site-specific DNA recombinase